MNVIQNYVESGATAGSSKGRVLVSSPYSEVWPLCHPNEVHHAAILKEVYANAFTLQLSQWCVTQCCEVIEIQVTEIHI